MYSFTTIIAASIAVFGPLVSASAPQSPIDANPNPAWRPIGSNNVKVCVDYGFNGNCFQWQFYGDSGCLAIDRNPANGQGNGIGNDQASAISVAGYDCTFFRDYNCEGPAFRVFSGEQINAMSGATQDLSGNGFGFNDQLSAFHCWPRSV